MRHNYYQTRAQHQNLPYPLPGLSGRGGQHDPKRRHNVYLEPVVMQLPSSQHHRPGISGHEGFGAIGPLGNAATITGGTYKITGTGVNFRNSALQPSGGMLNIGDDFTADGTVKGTEANGVYTNFAGGTSRLGNGYVAVQYLAPSNGFNPASYQPAGGGGGGGGTSIYSPASTTTTTTTTVVESNWTDYLPYAIGALAVGGIAYALFFTKPGRVTRRYARAKYSAHKRRRARRRGR